MANGKQLSQKGADFILDLMDSYIDVKEAVTPCVVRGGEKMTEEELEKEKCELLGIIQGKDKAIKDLHDNYDGYKAVAEPEIVALKTTILKLRNCMNCKHRDTRNYSSCKDKGIVLCSHWEMKE